MDDVLDEPSLTERLEEWAVDGLQEAQQRGDAGVIAMYRRALAYLSSTVALYPLLC